MVRIIFLLIAIVCCNSAFSQNRPWLVDANVYSMDHITRITTESSGLEYPVFESYGKSFGIGKFSDKTLTRIHLERFEATAGYGKFKDINKPINTRSGLIEYLYGLNMNHTYFIYDGLVQFGVAGGVSLFYIPHIRVTSESLYDVDNDGFYEYQVYTTVNNNRRMYGTLNANLYISADVFRRIHVYMQVFGQLATNPFVKMSSEGITPTDNYNISGVVSATGYGTRIGIGLRFD